MSVKNPRNQFMRMRAWLLAVIWILAPAAFADCAKDTRGEVYCGGGRCILDRDGIVWCSRFYEGGAQTTRDGRVLCGKGQCAKDQRGEIFCSTVVGGAALKDRKGNVRCYRRCERAIATHCENTRADSTE